MANKYLRHGETYCGDGTTSAAATSNGGVGAWNNINVFEGTAPAYGALVAGDTVYIRSKDASNAAITRTMTGNLNIGSTAATEANPITWIIDDGNIWGGVSSEIRYPNSGENYGFNFRANNQVVAEKSDGLVIVTSNTWGSEWIPLTCNGGNYLKNLKIDGAAWTQYNVRNCFAGAIVENLNVVGDLLRGAASQALFQGLEYGSGTNVFINLTCNLTGTGPVGSLCYGSAYAGSAEFTFIGGRIYGASADNGMYLVGVSNKNVVRFIGMQIPRTVKLAADVSDYGHRVEVTGCDVDGTGGYVDEYWGWATSRTDNYPPTLSATLPNSSLTPWAYRVYPRNASIKFPMRLPMTKMFTDTAASKTISLEMLVATTMTTSKKSLWMNVEYIDSATGLPVHLCTRNYSSPAMDSSSAAWSATTWGMVNFSKKKLSVVTPTSIKQNTLITVTLMGTVKSVTADDICFVDPDFGVN